MVMVGPAEFVVASVLELPLLPLLPLLALHAVSTAAAASSAAHRVIVSDLFLYLMGSSWNAWLR
jgi:hypothetical protein